MGNGPITFFSESFTCSTIVPITIHSRLVLLLLPLFSPLFFLFIYLCVHLIRFSVADTSLFFSSTIAGRVLSAFYSSCFMADPPTEAQLTAYNKISDKNTISE